MGEHKPGACRQQIVQACIPLSPVPERVISGAGFRCPDHFAAVVDAVCTAGAAAREGPCTFSDCAAARPQHGAPHRWFTGGPDDFPAVVDAQRLACTVTRQCARIARSLWCASFPEHSARARSKLGDSNDISRV